jgi:hypothetical protein
MYRVFTATFPTNTSHSQAMKSTDLLLWQVKYKGSFNIYDFVYQYYWQYWVFILFNQLTDRPLLPLSSDRLVILLCFKIIACNNSAMDSTHESINLINLFIWYDKEGSTNVLCESVKVTILSNKVVLQPNIPKYRDPRYPSSLYILNLLYILENILRLVLFGQQILNTL